MKQPSSYTPDFSDDGFAGKVRAESEAEKVPEFNGFPLTKVFFHKKFFNKNALSQARNILLNEVCNVYSQLHGEITVQSAD